MNRMNVLEDYYGIDLLRTIYILSVKKELPKEVNDIIKLRDLDTISQFTSLDFRIIFISIYHIQKIYC